MLLLQERVVVGSRHFTGECGLSLAFFQYLLPVDCMDRKALLLWQILTVAASNYLISLLLCFFVFFYKTFMDGGGWE